MNLDAILGDPAAREALKKIISYEEQQELKFKTDPMYKDLDAKPYWELLDIPVEWNVVKKLMFAGLVEKPAKKWYILKDRETIKNAILEYERGVQTRQMKAEESLTKIPDDLFDVVEGYEDLKTFIKLSLTAEEPVHCLLVGPPATAKSLFLMEIERLGGRFITAGTSTKVGIRDVIYDELPRILIIDELDKIEDPKDLSSLLTWMETGRIVIAKHGLQDERRGKGWVFAACNSLRGIPPELIDRFQVFNIKPYTREEFVRVVTGYLVKRKNVPEDLARYIAEKVQEYSVSVREAVRISRLAKSKDDVDKIIKIVERYR
jgi:Holliday junction DNA helicase RuvB